MTRARAVIAGLLLAALAGSAPGRAARADDPHLGSSHKGRRSVPARTTHAAPDITATIAKPPALPPPAGAEDNAIPPPFTLPVASRERVRACGETWRDMKLAGTTGDGDWRDFAMKCLSGPGPAARPD